MTPEDLQLITADFLQSDLNHITAENACDDACIGTAFYTDPLFGVADAADPLFPALRDPQITDPGLLMPADMLPGARRVISWFLPFSEAVRRGNARRMSAPGQLWQQARAEGQDANFAFGEAICGALTREGYSAMQPSLSDKFRMLRPFCSNWSERHVAYIAGLGTFGLSKGLITARGIAGRFGSVVTDAPLPVTKRPYDSSFAYCLMCGACARNCPAGAIDPKKGVALGKDHLLCSPFVKSWNSLQRCGSGERMRYGCGKCQVGVPCEAGIPRRAR